jgi:hypothetical protein
LDISRPPQSSQQPCSTEEILCLQSIIVGRYWTSSGIRSSHPGVCNCFCWEIPGHGLDNFLTINDLWQILLNQYLGKGLEGGGQDPLTPDHQYRTVEEGSSWEGEGPIQLPYIPLDSTIADNYTQYQNSAGIETDSMRNPPRPAKRSRIHSYHQLIWRGQ